jgi:hypothetical protein
LETEGDTLSGNLGANQAHARLGDQIGTHYAAIA